MAIIPICIAAFVPAALFKFSLTVDRSRQMSINSIHEHTLIVNEFRLHSALFKQSAADMGDIEGGRAILEGH